MIISKRAMWIGMMLTSYAPYNEITYWLLSERVVSNNRLTIDINKEEAIQQAYFRQGVQVEKFY